MLARWRRGGGRIALARVIRTDGSAPRGPGAAMVVHEDGRVAGSVSGGCVEGAVVTEALESLRRDEPARVRFGYSDDEAFAVGLTCGGTIELFVEPALFSFYDELAAALVAKEPVVVATVVGLRGADAPVDAAGDPRDATPFAYVPDRPGDVLEAPGAARLGASMLVTPSAPPRGSLGHPGLDAAVAEDARGALEAGTSGLRHYGPRGEARDDAVEVFLDAHVAPPKMVIFGAVDFTAALARVAKVLGYEVTVCDARAAFATPERFPMADHVVVEWPQRYLEAHGAELTERDAICVLTHDPKFDVPAIVAGLATRAGYLGAMGSRRTHGARVERLREAGVDDAALERLRAPIGLDLGARTPEETAVSIVAEIISARTHSGTRPLRDGSGPIHAGMLETEPAHS